MYIGIWGPGTFEMTRLNQRPLAIRRAASACSVGGGHVPRFMIDSALSAIIDSLRSLVLSRTNESRFSGETGPTGRSAKIIDTRFPSAIFSASLRTDTG